MPGADTFNDSLFATVKLEDFVPANHPLRPIRDWVSDALGKMDTRFSAMYEANIKGGRPSFGPEKLMRAMLLQVLYNVRSKRRLIEQIQYDLLFRWFVGLAIEGTVWNHSVFSKNRDRLIEHDAVTELFNATVEMAAKRGRLLGNTSAWMARSSTLEPATKACDARTDRTTAARPRTGTLSRAATVYTRPRAPESRPYRKSDAAPALSRYLGQVLTGNRHGPAVNVPSGMWPHSCWPASQVRASA